MHGEISAGQDKLDNEQARHRTDLLGRKCSSCLFGHRSLHHVVATTPDISRARRWAVEK